MFKDTNAKRQNIQTVTLEHVIQNYAIKKIDLLKIDTEGSEYDILYTLKPQYYSIIKQISVEYHQVDQNDRNGKALKAFLEDRGYTVKKKSFPGAVIGMLHAIAKK